MESLQAELLALRACPPPTDKEFAVLIKPLFDFAVAFGLAPDEKRMADMTAIYREALGTLPKDLIETAVKRIKASWKWGNRMPLPADVRETVGPEALFVELEERRINRDMRAVGEHTQQARITAGTAAKAAQNVVEKL